MPKGLYLASGILALLLGVLAFFTLFTVKETEHAIVTQFGDPIEAISEPGLKVKLPWRDVRFYEKRVLNLDPPAESMLLVDRDRLIVDSFVRYRIVDPFDFFRSVRTEQVLQARLSTITNSVVRESLGGVNLAGVLSEKREQLLSDIVLHLNEQAADQFGIEIVDLRFRRTDLPDEISERVYDRMRSEREREAKEFRAKGEQAALEIRAKADRLVTVIKAKAEREAEIFRGDGEGKRTRILNDAFGQDPDFFAFYRSMQAYKAALGSDNTYLVLSPDSQFFSYFRQATPLSATGANE